MNPNELQRAALAAIVRAGGKVYSVGPGWWGTSGGDEIEFVSPGGRPDSTITTLTIYALERMGALKRMNISVECHRDARHITSAGYAALEGKP